jgi:hypothetical protein
MQGLGGGDGINFRQPHDSLVHEQPILYTLEHVLHLVVNTPAIVVDEDNNNNNDAAPGSSRLPGTASTTLVFLQNSSCRAIPLPHPRPPL